jgi:hypothetical protein
MVLPSCGMLVANSLTQATCRFRPTCRARFQIHLQVSNGLMFLVVTIPGQFSPQPMMNGKVSWTAITAI